MTEELSTIVEQAYKLFRRYKATKPLDVCTVCCLTEKEEDALVSVGVKSIPFDLLYAYNTAAKTEKPDINEFKHFLPRFLDLTAQMQFPSHSIELGLSRFEYYDKNEWTTEEHDLVQEFGQHFFRHCLALYPLPDFEHIDSILIMLWKAKMNFNQLLNDWVEMTTSQSLLHFSDLVNNGFGVTGNKLSNPFTDQGLNKTLVEWLNMENVKTNFARKIEEAMLNPGTINDEKLIELSWVYERVVRR